MLSRLGEQYNLASILDQTYELKLGRCFMREPGTPKRQPVESAPVMSNLDVDFELMLNKELQYNWCVPSGV